MTKAIRIFTLVLVVALALATFGTRAQAQGPTKITLKGWSSSPSENARLQKIIDTFNKNNPDIQVTLINPPGDYNVALNKDLGSGSPPDVFYLDSFRFPDLAS